MSEVSKVRPHSALYDLELEIYTEYNGGTNIGFVSGSGANRFVAVYNEYKEPDFVWVHKSAWTKCLLCPWKYLLYAFLFLLLMSVLAIAMHYFVMPEAWFKTYVEGDIEVSQNFYFDLCQVILFRSGYCEKCSARCQK